MPPSSDAKTVIFCVCLSTSKPKYSSCLIFFPASISSWLTGKPLASVCGVMSHSACKIVILSPSNLILQRC
jgi:hypothetical protein